jgi:hypothetical protein
MRAGGRLKQQGDHASVSVTIDCSVKDGQKCDWQANARGTQSDGKGRSQMGSSSGCANMCRNQGALARTSGLIL